ncbi:arrestin domain-containing protein 3-like isoform X2 [Episyrphus balteatus]|nr:arrestin domain-containing protein 3-like isoform X2 [Episyrphus balteatus]
MDSVTECLDTKGLKQTLDIGTYEYKFECALPSECPSSFEGLYGRIRYDTKIIVNRPYAFNKSYKMGFNVLKIYDLNPLPELRIPTKLEELKHFCCGPCKSRPLVISLEIQRTSFVPGEFIEFKAKLINNSRTTVQQVDVILNLFALYSQGKGADVETKKEKIVVAKKTFEAYYDKEVLEFNDKLQVPPTPPTCIGLCRIIKLTYEVVVIAKIRGPHLIPTVAIPVIIGNIPYIENATDLSEATLIANLTNGIVSKSSANEEFPLPSYEEAKYVESLIEAPMACLTPNIHYNSEKFTPRYPFYGKVSHNNTEN